MRRRFIGFKLVAFLSHPFKLLLFRFELLRDFVKAIERGEAPLKICDFACQLFLDAFAGFGFVRLCFKRWQLFKVFFFQAFGLSQIVAGGF